MDHLKTYVTVQLSYDSLIKMSYIRLSVSIIMSAMYGYTVLPKNDPFQKLAEETMHAIISLTYPSAAIVNVIPFLRFLPTWFPGAGFRRVAQKAKEKVTRLLDFPYQFVQDNLVGLSSKLCLQSVFS
jgi:hypothetical protein